mmetsp:Transcript_26922/g.62567  ORF Transcript_26922/g.62567 Transcript_26922/m.62567 type:complete len:757 (-) Transcript_26922:68-2338(-)
MPVLTTGAATTAAAGAVATGAFGYNRANYLFDAGLRFSRYTSGYNFAMAQAAQYRQDIRDLTALTVTKMDTYHVIGVIFFVLNFQLIMAGRLGVHGPSPPGYIMGVYWVCSTSALMFLCVLIWFTLHASARATAGMAHMLTRSVRLPIPTPKQLDKARRTGNMFEKQRVTDVFRVPFVVPAPKDAPADDGPDPAKKATGAPEKGGAQRRMPKWYQDEAKELHASKGAAAATRGANPEHFELYRGLQQEWAVHDCYARIGILYFFSHWITAAALYTQCHCFGELRAIWPAWSCSSVFCTAHWCMLKLDIQEESDSKFLAQLPLENVVPFTPLLLVAAMSLDYSVLVPNDGWIAVIYLISWVAYVIHFVWSLRLFELAMPHPQADPPEVAGKQWTPGEWWLPRAFSSTVYIVAPPKQLEPGNVCLQQELKAAKGNKGVNVPQKKAKEAGPMLYPWKLFRGAILTNICLWIFMMFGRVFDQVHGERQLLKQEGRVMRWPSHMQPWTTPWTRNGTRNEWAHTGGSDRRLEAYTSRRDEKVMAMAERLTASLGALAEALEEPQNAQELARPFEVPGLLAGHSSTDVVAYGQDLLSPLAYEGHGAHVHLPKEVSMKLSAKISHKFIFEGLSELGGILGSSWAPSGLLVATESGAVAECQDLPQNGRWLCQQVAVRLPTFGGLAAAAAVRLPSGALRAAVSAHEEDGVVVFEADLTDTSWTPVGEVQLPHPHKVPRFSFDSRGDHLIVSSHSGALKWRLGDLK